MYYTHYFLLPLMLKAIFLEDFSVPFWPAAPSSAQLGGNSGWEIGSLGFAPLLDWPAQLSECRGVSKLAQEVG